MTPPGTEETIDSVAESGSLTQENSSSNSQQEFSGEDESHTQEGDNKTVLNPDAAPEPPPARTPVEIIISLGSGEQLEFRNFLSPVALDQLTPPWEQSFSKEKLEPLARNLTAKKLLVIFTDSIALGQMIQEWVLLCFADRQAYPQFFAYRVEMNAEGSVNALNYLIKGAQGTKEAFENRITVFLASFVNEYMVDALPAEGHIAFRSTHLQQLLQRNCNMLITAPRSLRMPMRHLLGEEHFTEITEDQFLLQSYLPVSTAEAQLKRIKEQRSQGKWGDRSDTDAYIDQLREALRGGGSTLQMHLESRDKLPVQITAFPSYHDLVKNDPLITNILFLQTLLISHFPGMRLYEFEQNMRFLLHGHDGSGYNFAGRLSFSRTTGTGQVPLSEIWAHSKAKLLQMGGIHAKSSDSTLAGRDSEGEKLLIQALYSNEPFLIQVFYQQVIRNGLLAQRQIPGSRLDSLRSLAWSMWNFGGPDLLRQLVTSMLFFHDDPALRNRIPSLVALPWNELEDRVAIILSGVCSKAGRPGEEFTEGILKELSVPAKMEKGLPLIIKMLNARTLNPIAMRILERVIRQADTDIADRAITAYRNSATYQATPVDFYLLLQRVNKSLGAGISHHQDRLLDTHLRVLQRLTSQLPPLHQLGAFPSTYLPFIAVSQEGVFDTGKLQDLAAMVTHPSLPSFLVLTTADRTSLGLSGYNPRISRIAILLERWHQILWGTASEVANPGNLDNIHQWIENLLTFLTQEDRIGVHHIILLLQDDALQKGIQNSETKHKPGPYLSRMTRLMALADQIKTQNRLTI